MTVDTVVPGSHLRGKRADLQRRAGEYVDELLRWGRDENGRYLPLNEWLNILRVVNIENIQYETDKHQVDINKLIGTRNTTLPTRSRLRAMLRQAPEPVAAFLTPHTANDRITFVLTEIILVGRLALA